MADNKQPTAPADTGDARKPILVRVLKFHRAIDLPGKEATEGVTSGGPPNGSRFEIEYLPGIRHHKITCHRPGEKSRIIYMHETQAYLWEPAL